ncbi:MAG: PspA/IM30 family protein [Actinomycetota bacterium]
MLKRIWGYIKQLFRGFAESAMDPEVEIEQAISEARAADQRLRNQAAKVIAHRTQLESKIEQAASDVGEAREMAKQAILKAEEAKEAGDSAGVDKWTRAAESLAMKIQAAESNVEGLKQQYEVALEQAEDAKAAVQQNAMRVQELAAKRMQLLGKLEQAKMQESVNSAMEAMTSSMEREAPSLRQVEEKIEGRLSSAKAHTELREVTPEGAEQELKEAVAMTQADTKLEELRKELGLS